MALANTIFEKLHGNYTIERFIDIIFKYEQREKKQELKLFKKIQKIAIGGAFGLVTLLNMKHDHFLNSIIIGSLSTVCIALLTETNLWKEIFISKKSPLAKLLHSFDKEYKEIKNEYNTALKYFKHNIVNIDFQVDIFTFLKKLEKQLITNQQSKNRIIISNYVNKIQHMIDSLENYFSLEQYEEAVNEIMNYHNDLKNIINFIEQEDKLIKYKENLNYYLPKLQILKSDINQEQTSKIVIPVSSNSQYAYAVQEDIDYRSQV